MLKNYDCFTFYISFYGIFFSKKKTDNLQAFRNPIWITGAFTYSLKWNSSFKDEALIPLNRSTQNRICPVDHI